MVPQGSADAPMHAQRLSDLIPTAEVAMLDRGGTLLQLDAPDVIADLITRFVAQLDTTPAQDSRGGGRGPPAARRRSSSLLQLWAK